MMPCPVQNIQGILYQLSESPVFVLGLPGVLGEGEANEVTGKLFCSISRMENRFALVCDHPQWDN